MFIDSHTHLYLENFDKDRDEVVNRALKNKVSKLLLPNIDNSTLGRMMEMVIKYPGVCYPMIGLHPGSVDEKFADELELLKKAMSQIRFYAIGEVGVDLYWDKKFEAEQKEAFRVQINWAKESGLPLVIHSRESFREIFKILDNEMEDDLTGVFHSFTGGKAEIEKIMDYGFYFGINGIVSFKNSDLRDVIKYIPPDKLLLETDAPYLAPVPKRGKRNESSYLPFISSVIAEITGNSKEEIENISCGNAEKLFNLD